MQNISVAVIPVAGIGSRMYPFSSLTPKELLPVGDKFIFNFILEELGNVPSIKRIILIISRSKLAIFDKYFLQQIEFKELLDRFNIEYILQDDILGLADAVDLASCCLTKEECFFLVLPDEIIIHKALNKKNYTLYNILNLYHKHLSVKNALLLTHNIEHNLVSSYGIVEGDRLNIAKNELFQVTRLIEKPAINETTSTQAIIGRYILPYKIFDYIAKLKSNSCAHNGEFQITEAIHMMQQDCKNVYSVMLDENFYQRYDAGSIKGYNKLFCDYSKKIHNLL